MCRLAPDSWCLQLLTVFQVAADRLSEVFVLPTKIEQLDDRMLAGADDRERLTRAYRTKQVSRQRRGRSCPMRVRRRDPARARRAGEAQPSRPHSVCRHDSDPRGCMAAQAAAIVSVVTLGVCAAAFVVR